MRLKPGAKFFLFLIVIILLGAGAYRMGWLDGIMGVIAPDRQTPGTVTEDMFPDNVSNGQDTPVNQPPPQVSKTKLDRPVRVGIVQYGGFAGGLMANGGTAPNANSILAKEAGAEVEFVQIDDLVQMADAFRVGGDGGGIDMMATTIDMFALQYDALKDIKPVTFLQTDWSRGADAIAVRSGINSVEDLKGKKIAVAEASPSHFLLLYALTQGGLTNLDVNYVFTNDAISAADIFTTGNADACVSWSPFVYFAVEAVPGSDILASTLDATNLLGGTMVVRGEFAARYPDVISGFLSGWFRGVDMVNADMEAGAETLLGSFAGITMDDAMGMLYDVKLAGATENRQFFGLDGESLMGYDDVWIAASKVWITINKLGSTTRPDLTRKTTFLADATADIAGTVEPPTTEFEFEEPTPAKQAEPGIVTKRVSVYFAYDSDVLDDKAKRALKGAAELAQTFGSAYIKVSGNTDSTGGRAYNVDLSQRRAQSVVNYMVSEFDFPPDKFIVVGNGPDKPVATNDTEAGRQENRRTDFEVIPQQ